MMKLSSIKIQLTLLLIALSLIFGGFSSYYHSKKMEDLVTELTMKNRLSALNAGILTASEFIEDYTLKEHLQGIHDKYPEEYKFIYDDYDDVITSLELVTESVNRINNIIKFMLDLNKSKLTDTNFKEENLKDIIETNVKIISKSFLKDRNTKIDINLEIPDDLMLNCSRLDINRLFVNILVNSFYAILKKQETQEFTPQIKINAITSNEAVSICVKDNGIGIDKETLPKIFEPLYTTKPGTEGSGIGMSMVYDIVKNHNGEISVKSDYGDFTEIYIVFTQQD